MRRVLPGARFELFEPLAGHRTDYREQLDALLNEGGDIRLHALALGDEPGTIDIAMTDDGVGSSVHMVKSVASTPVRVERARLDDLARERAIAPADLVKMDVQASEDAILRGMGSLLDHAQVLILETWLRRCYGPKTPLLPEMVSVLRDRGFTFVRVIDEYYNDRHELLAMDAVFIRRELLERINAKPGALIEQPTVAAR
jgi:FkbM family methyltransferase